MTADRHGGIMEFISSVSGVSLGEYLKKYHGFSRRIISRLKFENGILVNGKPEFTNFMLHENDVITVIFSEKKSENTIPQQIPINILYEDSHLLAVNKPPFMPIHPSHGHSFGTLANAVSGYYAECGISSAVRIYGRLDRDTSGVVLISKNPLAAKLLFETEVEKYYLAIVCGTVLKGGEINAPILDLERGMRRLVNSAGKPAVTQYEPLESADGFTLLKLKLLTGRTHQIRVHTSYMGFPILGDTLYGGAPDMPRQALHAYRLRFIHPVFKTPVEITAPVPDDMKEFLCQHIGNKKFES